MLPYKKRMIVYFELGETIRGQLSRKVRAWNRLPTTFAFAAHLAMLGMRDKLDNSIHGVV